MSRMSNGLDRELYDLKMKAEEYYRNNGVPEKMEDVLNSMFMDQPPDVYGHVANFFIDFAKSPVITKMKCRMAYDSSCYSTMQTEVYCMVRNYDTLISTCLSSCYAFGIPDIGKQEDKDTEEANRLESVKVAMNLINTDISNKLKDLNPKLQDEVDSIAYDLLVKLKEAEEAAALLDKAESCDDEQKSEKPPDASSPGKKNRAQTPKGKGKGNQVVAVPNELPEMMFPGSSAVSAVSRTVCTAAACLKHVPLYEHVASLAGMQDSTQYTLPLPMVTILQNGRSAPGKLNCVSEFMVIPKPGMSAHEGIEKIVQIFRHISKTLVGKGGSKRNSSKDMSARNVTDIGALCPALDKPEQGLDLIQDAMTALEIQPGEDFNIGLRVAAHDMFDMEKGKYEIITGQLKSPEDLVEFWVELLGRYPAVNVIIDPIRKEDRVSWLKLCDRVTSHCYVIGDCGYHRPGRLITEDMEEVYGQYQTSGIVLRLEQMNTVTHIIECSKKMKEANNDIVIATCQGESTDTFIADFAVGLGAKFLKLGAPCRGERISVLNRLLQTEDLLEEKGMLGSQNEHVYNHIELPPTPEPAETEENTPTPTKKDAKKK
ncbi:enolase 4-like isoform X2 [Gigantopelta aegis]|uniref:enolase 4-like isoform X2 n=1 Tax=Gigantopelta aegis TaxID=1735272 RepID=UPI001B88A786|nr:enolase 4-like isoform X2 [Gigantopelta aegis]